MAGSTNTLGGQSDDVPSGVTDHELTSSTSSLLLGTMVTTHVTNHSIVDMVTEKPFGEFLEVKVAVLLERIYIPILVAVGVPCNFLCFVTLVFTSLRNTSTCVYMAAIAVLDCVILIHSLCIQISRYLGHAEYYMYNDWNCGFQHFLFYFAIHFDVLLLLAMTVDRFIVVRFPLKAQRLCTPKSAIKVIIGLGIFSFALNFQIFFNRRLVPTGRSEDPLRCWYPEGEIKTFMEKIYTIIDATIYSFIPFLSLLTLNLLIIRQLNQSSKFSRQFTEGQGGNNMNESAVGDTKKAKANTNITLMLLMVSFTFLGLTSPIVIMYLYQRYNRQIKTNAERAEYRIILVVMENVMYSNHAVNFLLYSISGRRFRQELKQFLTRICWRQ
ncbi:putative G-protein coupled receptor 139 [Babylonia areolata]|uniref:putative G-protein coupled receptor 139 n=1 Tax=Babylonia areolata TaxID=304850 RepID=UPI003FD38DD6